MVEESQLRPLEELDYDIDNRDSRTTWLVIKTKKDEHVLGYIELSLKDMFGLIENVIENMEE